jgi:hypothetical protein
MPNFYDPRIPPSREPQISGSANSTTTVVVTFHEKQLSQILASFESLASKLGPTDLVCLVREVRALSALVHSNKQELLKMSAEQQAALAGLSAAVHRTVDVMGQGLDEIKQLLAQMADATSNNDVQTVSDLTAELTKAADGMSSVLGSLVAATPAPPPAPAPEPTPEQAPAVEQPAAEAETPAPASDQAPSA